VVQVEVASEARLHPRLAGADPVAWEAIERELLKTVSPEVSSGASCLVRTTRDA